MQGLLQAHASLKQGFFDNYWLEQQQFGDRKNAFKS
jgi:hypothetical protein